MTEVGHGGGQYFLYLGGDEEARNADQLELGKRHDPRR